MVASQEASNVQELRPTSAKELAKALRAGAESGRAILMEGAGSKARMGGRVRGAGTHISTAALDRLLAYDPRDLTISVEAGMPWRTLTALLDEQGQMLPLDPPRADRATVGGVIAANCSGPRRRLYGAARDMVIGMQVATTEGELIESGGMVVKNVAGYDLQKLLIGSFGTLGAMSSVNFQLSPKPEATATFVLASGTLEEALAARDRVLCGALQPAAVDMVNAAAAAELGLAGGAALLVRAGGSGRVLDRFARELAGAARIEQEAESELWRAVEDFAAAWVEAHPEAVVVRAGFPMKALGAVLAAARGPALARAGTGLAWLRYENAAAATEGIAALTAAGADALIEWAGDGVPDDVERWPGAGDGLELMRRVKSRFDPAGLLNPGRLHGRI